MLSPLPSIIPKTTLTDLRKHSLKNSKLSFNEKTKTQWLVKANIKQVDLVVPAP